MDTCGNRFAITRSRPQAYYYMLEKGESSRDPRTQLTIPVDHPVCVNHVPGLKCQLSPRLLNVCSAYCLAA